MNKSENEVIKGYFSRLQLELIVAKYSDPVPADWGRPLRADEYHRLYFIVGGEGRIEVDGHTFHPSARQLVLLPAGIPLSYSTINSNIYKKYWCHFSAKVGSFHLSRLIDFPYSLTVRDTGYVTDLFEQLQTASQTSGDMTSPLKVNRILLELLTYFIDNMPPQSIRLSSSPDTRRSNEILQYMEEHLSDPSEPLTPRRLAEAFHYNPNYFSRYFKSLFQLSPGEYINKVRIERAKRLLTQSNLTVEEIARRVGLERFYFSNMFKRSTKLSPSEYR
ncbi:MAG: transcriptional regulator, AraC family, partial [Paenibacillus sp.]|nr:transcriptional regulator, AraC family [Paenibacillus sp.]